MYYSALIGKPTDHSVSDILFGELMKIANIHESYAHIKIDVELGDLEGSIRALSDLHFIGINVTLPYKLLIMPLITSLDESAIEVGAVNTIKFNGKISKGYNTDWNGIYYPIKAALIQRGISAQTVTIFGTGGAAYAAIYAAKKLGADKIKVLFRGSIEDDELAKRLYIDREKYGIEMYNYEDVMPIVQESAIIINATSAGMIGNSDKSPFDLDILNRIDVSNKIFLDAVFNPVNTPLLSAFKNGNAVVIDGLWMMLYQAVAALGIWLDQTITVSKEQLEELHDLLETEISHV